MLNKFVSLLLVLGVSGIAGINPVYADFQDERQTRATVKIKQKIKERGIGENARVEVILQDGAKLKGYISEAGEDSFVITAANNGASTRLTYSQVKQVKGGGRSTGAKILIGLGIAAGASLILSLIVDD